MASNDYNDMDIDSKLEEEFKLDNYEEEEAKKNKPSPIRI